MSNSASSQHGLTGERETTSRFLWSCLLLLAVYGAGTYLAVWLGESWYGPTGRSAGLAAGGIGFFAMQAALAIAWRYRDPKHSVIGVLLATVIRTVLPFGALMLLGNSDLARHGFANFMLTFYLVGLVVETSLHLWILKSEIQRVTNSVADSTTSESSSVDTTPRTANSSAQAIG